METAFVILLGLLLFSLRLILGEIFYRKPALRLENSTARECLGDLCGLTSSYCAIVCQTTDTCVSFNFRPDDGTCQLNFQSLYDFGANAIASTDWNYYGPVPKGVTENGWILAFLAKSGINVPITDVWNAYGLSHDLDLSSQDPALFSKYAVPRSTHFRSHWLDDWDTAPIAKVRLVLYENGSEVASLMFDGVNSTNSDWFSLRRLLSSPWGDLVPGGAAIFSLSGLFTRKFYITNATMISDCSNHEWLTVLNRESNWCIFDTIQPPPQFLYSPKNTYSSFSSGEYKLAEVMAIFIMMT